MRKTLILAVVMAVLLILFAAPAAAQNAGNDESVLVRVNGDVSIPAGETEEVVVVVNGDLDFEGTATTVVVVSGRARLVGATVDTLVVVDGSANLGADTTVTGDVHLIESDLSRDPSAVVEGTIERGTGDFSQAFWLLGVLFMIGWAVMTVLAAMVLAAVAPNLVRRSGRTITAEIGPTILAGLIVWIAMPILGVILFATAIGVPTALTIWFVLLPALGVVGIVVAGVRLGEYLTGGREGIGHPYLAAFVGTLLLVAVGIVPFIGPIVVAVAGFLGSGALAVQAFRSIQSEPESALPPPAPDPAASVAEA